jgi:hypothetical protein
MEKNCLALNSIISKVYQKSLELSQKEFLKEIVNNLLIEVGYRFNFSQAPVERIPDFLGISVDIGGKLITDAELHRKQKSWSIGVSPDQTTHFSGETVFTERGRFSLAHEIAHFLLHYISEKFAHVARAYNLDVSQKESKDYEKLCDFVSGEFLAPTHIFQTNSLRDLIEKIGDLNGRLLNISVLEALRQALNVSRIVLIKQLHHTRVLEESRCGIVVSFFGVNKNTGRSPALRVFSRALPRWGFIPENIKLSSIGLLSALHVFEDFGYGKPREWKEKIKVQEKKVDKEERKGGSWLPRVFESYGQHVTYPYGERQKYLITTLSWPRP